MKKVSVVIPVYNVEKYLPECLDSVINQTYKNLQIILVDDGSTDNSGNICDEYAQKDNRIQVIHQQNAGAGAAKNTGLELVEGEYLSLIDSDDWIDLDFYETMVNEMEQNNVDIVQCMFKNVFVNTSYDRKYNFQHTHKKMSAKRFLFEYLYDWKYAIFANKMFKTELLQDARFPVGRKIDDEFFTYKLVCNAKKILCIDKPMYNYRMRGSSVMNSNNNDRLIIDRVPCFVERYHYIKNHISVLEPIIYYHLYSYIFSIDSEIINMLDQKYCNEIKRKPSICLRYVLSLLLFIYRFNNEENILIDNEICFD